MKRTSDLECRRCGQVHEECWQLIDPNGRWAVATVPCTCGHVWTVVQSAPINLRRVRSWVQRGCRPAEGPMITATGAPWKEARLEGIGAKTASAAS